MGAVKIELAWSSSVSVLPRLSLHRVRSGLESSRLNLHGGALASSQQD